MAELTIALCGKGGVGKTVVSALLSRALLRRGMGPALLIDADPAGGLCSAIGIEGIRTLADVRDDLIAAVRSSEVNEAEQERLINQVDYLLLDALVERDDHALLAMGHSREPGCFCSVNRLLRDAIEHMAAAFRLVMIDAEAGIEQINRQVISRASQVIVVVDNSARSRNTLEQIARLTDSSNVAVIVNRHDSLENMADMFQQPVLGTIPENSQLDDFDRRGASLWSLPDENPCTIAADAIATKILDGRKANTLFTAKVFVK